MKRFFLVLIALVLLIGAGTYSWLAFGPVDERTRLLMHDPHGEAAGGTVLGVRIGAPWSEADHALRTQFDFGSPLHRSGRSGVGNPYVSYSDDPVLTGEAEAHYRDQSWRKGYVTLLLQDGIVVGVQWDYVGPFFIDP